jgi:uncharacterized membrane protein YgdD (TMEM256/DUF423 family)
MTTLAVLALTTPAAGFVIVVGWWCLMLLVRARGIA